MYYIIYFVLVYLHVRNISNSLLIEMDLINLLADCIKAGVGKVWRSS